MIRLLIDPESLIHYPYGGISIYQYHLLRELVKNSDLSIQSCYMTFREELFSSLDGRLSELGLVKSHRIKLPGRLASNFLLKYYIRSKLPKEIDLIHLPAFTAKDWMNQYSCPKVLTIHDMIFMRHPDKGYIPKTPESDIDNVIKNVKQASAILTVSEFTKKELCELIDVDPEQVFVSPLSTQWRIDELSLKPELLQQHKLVEKKYFISVGLVSKRKNYESLIKAFTNFNKGNDFKLLIIGKSGWQCDELAAFIRQSKNVVWLETVDTADLYSLYSFARASFLVSWYEGFGIPLLESMSCSVPVCYARGTSMDDVAGNTGIAVDANDLSEIESAMKTYVEMSDEDYAICQRSALEQSKLFSWEQTAVKTMDAFNFALERT